jgi:aspartate aminotransferase
MLVSKAMRGRLAERSAIRQAFERAEQLKSERGCDEAFDFSIGNPTAPCPPCIGDAFASLGKADASGAIPARGYMASAGYAQVRAAIAKNLQATYTTPFTQDDIIMTTGAACAINTLMQTLLDPQDEVIVFKPHYPAYSVFVQNWGGRMVAVDCDPETLLPDLRALEQALSEHTKLVIVNTPNNPTGLVWPADIAQSIAETLDSAQVRFGHPIVLLSDEPYRDLVYDDAENPWWPALYDNTAVAYSYSKSASLAGERIGYLALSPNLAEGETIRAGVLRSLGDVGFVNAPATAQQLALACETDAHAAAGKAATLAYYDRNRRALAQGLVAAGFSIPPSQGAFYQLLPAPDGDEDTLLARLLDQGIVAVGGTDFGCPGAIRLSYCQDAQTIARALPRFAAVAESYGLDPKGPDAL